MDDLVQRIYDKYIEDLVAIIELQKIITFLIYLSLTVFLLQDEKMSIWFNVINLNFKDFFDIKSEFWNSLKIGNIALSLALSLMTGYVYSFIKNRCFILLARIKNPNNYLDQLRSMIITSLTGNKEIDLALVKEWSKDLPDRKRKIARMHILGEIILSISIGSMIGFVFNKTWLDIVFFIVFIIISLLIQWQSYLYFLRKVVPIYLPQDLLFGINISAKEAFFSSTTDD